MARPPHPLGIDPQIAFGPCILPQMPPYITRLFPDPLTPWIPRTSFALSSQNPGLVLIQ